MATDPDRALAQSSPTGVAVVSSVALALPGPSATDRQLWKKIASEVCVFADMKTPFLHKAFLFKIQFRDAWLHNVPSRFCFW